MRGIMIYFGVVIAEKFKIVTLVFAIILLVSSFKMLYSNDDDDDDLDNNYIMVLSKKFLRTSTSYDGDRFFTIVNGVRVATPLFLCLICVEFSDVIFAIDSIPAVLGIVIITFIFLSLLLLLLSLLSSTGVSHDHVIVYSSNIFAILGLRALYTIIAKAVSDLPFIKPAVALILFFVGIKMIFEYFGYSISTGLSLFVVGGLLVTGIFLSLVLKSTTSPLLSKYLKAGTSTDKKSKHSV